MLDPPLCRAAPSPPRQIIRGEAREESLPPLEEYLKAAAERLSAIQAAQKASYAAGQAANTARFGFPQLWR